MLYITERCVFALKAEGLELIEAAPGVDIERDILSRMEFKPLIPHDPAEMDARIFKPEPMGLREALVGIPLDQRLTYDPLQNLFFVNFERLSVTSRVDIEAIEKRSRPSSRR